MEICIEQSEEDAMEL